MIRSLQALGPRLGLSKHIPTTFYALPAQHTTRALSTNSVQNAPVFSRAVKSANPPMDFPCIDRLETRQKDLAQEGPEPHYQRVVTGYELYSHKEPFVCSHGGVLPKYDIAYETWGTLNSARDNAVLIHTGLSASSHARSHDKNPNPGWWEKFIGPGLAIDTNKFFVICTNAIGGCYGSTGPGSIDPATGYHYGSRFPLLTINDIIRAQFNLLDSLKIDKLYASVGASMGGMQSLMAAKLFPERVGRLITISACARSHPYSIALRFAQRQVLMSDPNFNRGFYYGKIPPHVGMKLARQIATVTYRSGPEWEQRFGRRRQYSEKSPAFCPDFLIETYIDHQSEKFCLQYDANSLIYLSKAMDMFDVSASVTERLDKNIQEAREKLSKGGSAQNQINPTVCMVESEQGQAQTSPSETESDIREDLVKGVENIQHPTLVLGVQSDILFPIKQQKEIADILREAGNSRVTYYELDALYGHDTFLIDVTNVGAAIKGHLENLIS